MQSGPSLSAFGWSAAQDILNSLMGDLLGWIIVLALLSPFALILYVVLKKSGWRFSVRTRYPGPTRVVVRTAYGLPQDVQEKLLGQLGNPNAHTETTKLDLSDPQARARIEQFLQGLGAMDPAGKAKLEEALRIAEGAHGKASFTLVRSEQTRVGDAAAAGPAVPPAPDLEAAPSEAPAVIDGAAVPTPPPAPGLGPTTHGPSLLGGAPDWHQELQEKWQRERDEAAHADHVAFTQGLERNRAALRAFIRPVRYAITGLCGLAVAACLLKGQAHNEYNILALVLAGCAAWAWFGFNPDDVG